MSYEPMVSHGTFGALLLGLGLVSAVLVILSYGLDLVARARRRHPHMRAMDELRSTHHADR